MNIQVKDNTMTITVDVSPATIKSAPLSSSGKNRLVATSGGNMAVATPHGILKVGLNVFTSR